MKLTFEFLLLILYGILYLAMWTMDPTVWLVALAVLLFVLYVGFSKKEVDIQI